MQLIVILALAFAAVCSGQGAADFAKLPECARTCALGSIPKDCNLDVKCICSKQSFIHDIACCVNKACAASDVQKSLQVAQQLCSTVSVTVPADIPTDCPGGSGSASSSAPAASGSAAASSGASSAANSAAAATATAAATPARSTSTNAAVSSKHFGQDIGVLGAAVIAAAFL